jgi:hypothetical protein
MWPAQPQEFPKSPSSELLTADFPLVPLGNHARLLPMVLIGTGLQDN